MYASEAGMDDEYSALMAELGETPTGGSSSGGHAASAGGGIPSLTGGDLGSRGGGMGRGRGGHRGGFQNPRELFGPPKGEEEQNPANAAMQGYYGKLRFSSREFSRMFTFSSHLTTFSFRSLSTIRLCQPVSTTIWCSCSSVCLRTATRL